MEANELNERYKQYKGKIEARIATGETTLKVKSKQDWTRVVEVDGKKVSLPGESGETAGERGARVAEKRMDALITANERLYQLKASTYQLTETQVSKMVEKIESDAKNLCEMLRGKLTQVAEKKPEKQKFKF